MGGKADALARRREVTQPLRVKCYHDVAKSPQFKSEDVNEKDIELERGWLSSIRGGPRGGLGGYHSSPSAWVPKLASTREIPPLLPGLGRQGGGLSPSARAVWADWLEWMGRKTAQAVRNRISSVLSNLGNQADGEEW